MVIIVPPSVISGSARRARSRNDQQDTSIAVRNPSRGQSVTRPASASRGAKAMEWTRMSSRPHLAAIAANSASACAGVAHLQRQEQRRIDRLRQRLDIGPRLVVQIGHRDLGAGAAHRLGAAPGDRVVVGDADDQRLPPVRTATVAAFG